MAKKNSEQKIESSEQICSDQHDSVSPSNPHSKKRAQGNEVRRGRPSKTKQIQKQNFDIKNISPTYSVSFAIKKILINFFDQIQKPNGLTFSVPIRIKMNQERRKHNLSPLNAKDKRKYKNQKEKIQAALKQFELLNKNYQNHSQVISADKKVNEFKKLCLDIIYESCGIFCQQVTKQMYRIFVKIFNILYSNINNQKDSALALRQLGNKIANKKCSEYEYFNFNFGNGSTIKKIVLSDKFRAPNGYYSKVIEDIGKSLNEYLQKNKQKMFYKVNFAAAGINEKEDQQFLQKLSF